MKVPKLFPALSALLLLLAALGPVSAQRKPRIAVLDFDYATVQSSSQAFFGTNVDIGKGITQMLITNLVKDGSYSVIERSAMDKILNEQNFSNSNRADTTSAAKIGKLLGVDAIIVGSITEFGNETKNQGLGGGGGSGWSGALGSLHRSKSNANVAVNARIVSVDTGEILGVAEGSGTSSRASMGMGGGGGNWNGHGGGGVDFGSSDFQNTIIGEATKAAVQKLSTEVVADAPKISLRSITVEGLVAAVVNGQVILNVGKKAGIKPGDQFTVQRGTQVIKDPATGAVLRTLSTKVGVIQAADVDDVSAVCNVVSGAGFKVGDSIKTVTQ